MGGDRHGVISLLLGIGYLVLVQLLIGAAIGSRAFGITASAPVLELFRQLGAAHHEW